MVIARAPVRKTMTAAMKPAVAASPAGLGRSTANLSGSRGRVLVALRAADRPLSVDELADQLGLHRNTVRFHLDALTAAGLVDEGRQQTGGRGRPRAVFHPTSHGVRSGQRNYQLLAGVLVGHLARTSLDPVRDAQDAGREWGQQLATAQPVTGYERHRTAVPAVVEMLEEMGFEPRPDPDRDRRPACIHLHNCPFREVADEHQELVCAVHAGLLEGMLAPDPRFGDRAERAEPAVGVWLEPWATPQTCLVHLQHEVDRPAGDQRAVGQQSAGQQSAGQQSADQHAADEAAAAASRPAPAARPSRRQRRTDASR